MISTGGATRSDDGAIARRSGRRTKKRSENNSSSTMLTSSGPPPRGPRSSAARRWSSCRAEVPLVDRLAHVDSLVTLEADQLPARPFGQGIGHLGLAPARLTFEEQRAAEHHGQEDRRGQTVVGQVAVPLERVPHIVGRLRTGQSGGRGRFPEVPLIMPVRVCPLPSDPRHEQRRDE